MYFKICHYEILIIILSLPQKLTFFQEYATLSVQKQNEENYGSPFWLLSALNLHGYMWRFVIQVQLKSR